MKFCLARLVLLVAFASVLSAAEPSLVPDAPSTVPDYFCTWNVQGFACSYAQASDQADMLIEFGPQGDVYRTYDVNISVSIPETIRRIAAFLAKDDPHDQRLITRAFPATRSPRPKRGRFPAPRRGPWRASRPAQRNASPSPSASAWQFVPVLNE